MNLRTLGIIPGMSIPNRLLAKRPASLSCTLLLLTLAAIALLSISQAQSGPRTGATVEAEAQAFVGPESGYRSVDVASLEDALEAELPASDSVFLASGRLSPFAKALLVVETTDGLLPRTRHHLSVRVLSVEEPPANDPASYLFLQVDRYNLGPAIRDELISSIGPEHVAPLSEFGEGPHVSWRFVMHQVMGQNAAIYAAGRAQIADAAALSASCLGAPCLTPTAGVEELAVWHELEPVELLEALADLPYEALRAGLPSPAAMIDLATDNAPFNAYDAEHGGREGVIAEFIIESGLTQEPAMELALRQGDLLDDSVAAIWQRLLAFSLTGDAPEFYAGQAFECRRGDGGWAEPGEFCL